jgi:DNA-binding MarR family transcriptional regulator
MERDPAGSPAGGQLDLAAAETKLTALVETWESSIEELGCAVPAAQVRALLVIDRAGRMRLRRLARVLGASASATRRLCDRMAAAGLLRSEPAAARPRDLVVRATESGRRLAAWVRGRRREVLRRMVQPMSPAGRESLALGLSELATGPA